MLQKVWTVTWRVGILCWGEDERSWREIEGLRRRQIDRERYIESERDREREEERDREIQIERERQIKKEKDREREDLVRGKEKGNLRCEFNQGFWSIDNLQNRYKRWVYLDVEEYLILFFKIKEYFEGWF